MKHIPTPLIVAAILLVLLAALPLAFPYSLIQDRIENGLSRIVHGKASIGSIQFEYAPLPEFSLNHVSIDGEEQANISRIVIPLSVRNLVNLGKELYGIRVENAIFSQKFALGLTNRLTPDSSKQVRIQHIGLSDASIKLERGQLGPASAAIDLLPDGSLEKLSVQSPDNKLLLEIHPAPNNTFKVLFSAKNWSLPFGHPVEFEYINLLGTANQDGIQINDIRAGLYNGLVTGTGQLFWSDPWTLSGQVSAKNIRAEPLLQVFSPVTRATGILNGDATFGYEAMSYTDLFNNPTLSGRFVLNNGMLHNMDLITPLKSPSQEIIRHGGQTNFNLLNGSFEAAQDWVSLNKLHLESGKFRADGNLQIRNGKLSGNTSATLNAGAILASNTMSISGSLAAPEIRSSGAVRPRSEETAVRPIGQ